MLSKEKMEKRERVIEKFNEVSYMQDGYALAVLELNALYKEVPMKGFLGKVLESLTA